eukprot:10589335-Lingulodinium_polyedra.AAC.1
MPDQHLVLSALERPGHRKMTYLRRPLFCARFCAGSAFAIATFSSPASSPPHAPPHASFSSPASSPPPLVARSPPYPRPPPP